MELSKHESGCQLVQAAAEVVINTDNMSQGHKGDKKLSETQEL